MDKQGQHQACVQQIMAVHDAMDALGGRWKISILASLSFGKKRYSDLLREVRGISGKMLSRELKELEAHLLLTRTVLETQPVTVQYELTAYGQTLLPIITSLAAWGQIHRTKIMGEPAPHLP